MQIEWDGPAPDNPEHLNKCIAEIAELKLERPEDLGFHRVWFSGQPFGSDSGSGAVIWGVENYPHLKAKLFGNPRR